MRSLEGTFINGAAGETGKQWNIHLNDMIRYFNCKTRSRLVMLFIDMLTSALYPSRLDMGLGA
jgi:hypothetical protein